jgi:hypothetical protein
VPVHRLLAEIRERGYPASMNLLCRHILDHLGQEGRAVNPSAQPTMDRNQTAERPAASRRRSAGFRIAGGL